MKAKNTPLNKCEPVREEPCEAPVSEAAKSRPDEEQSKRTASHLTWEKPTRDELKQLNAAMAWKFIRLLLQSLVIFGNLSLLIWLKDSGLFFTAYVCVALCGSLLLIIYYLEYRAPLQFGERYSPANDFKDRSNLAFVFGICGLILAPFYFIIAYFCGAVCLIPAAVMAILTYRKEYFMLILFVCRKYTVKDGEVSWRRKYREYYHTENRIKGWSWTSLIYQLDFDDAEERCIPVLVDNYTYRRFKKNGKAILINYRYGDSYMYDIIRLKDE